MAARCVLATRYVFGNKTLASRVGETRQMTENAPNLCQLTRNHIAWNFLFTFSTVPGGTAAMKGAVIIDVDDDVF